MSSNFFWIFFPPAVIEAALGKGFESKRFTAFERQTGFVHARPRKQIRKKRVRVGLALSTAISVMFSPSRGQAEGLIASHKSADAAARIDSVDVTVAPNRILVDRAFLLIKKWSRVLASRPEVVPFCLRSNAGAK